MRARNLHQGHVIDIAGVAYEVTSEPDEFEWFGTNGMAFDVKALDLDEDEGIYRQGAVHFPHDQEIKTLRRTPERDETHELP